MAVPGFPTLLNRAANIGNTVALIEADARNVVRMFLKSKWGLYKDGNLVLQADAVTGFAYRQNTRVSQYPVEQGAFASYNKVGTPYEARLRLVRGGTVVDRQNFLSTLEKIVASTDVYDIVTPERTYISANVEVFDYDRTAQAGVGLITAELSITEVRQVSDNRTFTNAKKPSGADPVNVGSVQPQAASQSQYDALRSSGGAR